MATAKTKSSAVAGRREEDGEKEEEEERDEVAKPGEAGQRVLVRTCLRNVLEEGAPLGPSGAGGRADNHGGKLPGCEVAIATTRAWRESVSGDQVMVREVRERKRFLVMRFHVWKSGRRSGEGRVRALQGGDSGRDCRLLSLDLE